MLNTSLKSAATSLILILVGFAQPLWADETVVLPAPAPPPMAEPVAEQITEPSPVLMVSSAIVDTVFQPVAEGFAEWIRLRATEGGIAVVPGASVRRAIAAARPPLPIDTAQQGQLAPAPALNQEQFMAIAAEFGVRRALLLDLRSRNGRIEADFRLYDVADGKLSGGGLVEAPARRLIFESEAALSIIDERLGMEAGLWTPEELRSLTLSALSASTRALLLMDENHLGEAWREIDGRKNPLARSITSEIDKLAARPATSLTALAELANAKGDGRGAWGQIAEIAVESLREPTGAVSTLNAAGEAQLTIGGLRKARVYFDRALEVEPENAEATLGVAKVLAVERRTDEARVTFERAASLDLYAPEALELAAESASGDPALRAQLLLKAGDRHAARFDSEVAQQQFAKAIALDTTVEPLAARQSGDLHAKVGEYDMALAKYEVVRDAGHEEAGLLVQEARTQNAAGMTNEAAASYEKVLHDYDPDHGDALVELGDLYTEEGRAAEAVPLLEHATAQGPPGPSADRALARALADRGAPGDRTRALELLKASDIAGRWQTRDLRIMASLQAETGDFAAATRTLERALVRRELDIKVQKDIVAVMNAKGDPEAAGIWAARFSHNGLNDFIDQKIDLPRSKRDAFAGEFDELDQLIHSFGVDDKAMLVATFQGLREPMTPAEMARDWLMPRTTDKAALSRALVAALETQYTLVNPTELGENFRREVENMFDFDSNSSLSVRTITDLNIAHDTDAVLLARLVRKAGDSGAPYGSCWYTDHYELQLRRLAGKTDGDAAVLSNRACLAGGTEGIYGTWNRKASLPYGLLLLLMAYPFVRGWGRLEVAFELPENATAMFAVSLTKRPSKVRDRTQKTRAAATSVFRNQLRRVSRFERRLKGTHMTFRGVPAHRTRYYLTVRGPLIDLATNGLVGEFLEERVVKIDRGKVTHFKFDMRPREAMVTVEVKRGDTAVPRAQVAIRGVPGSTRFCPEGSGTIYVAAGEHVLVVGVEDRISEQTIQIQGVAPATVKFDVEYNFLFEGCQDAVGPYLDADYPSAIRALSEAGLDSAAAEVGRLRDNLPVASANVAPVDAGMTQVGDPDATSVERSPEAWADAALAYDQADEYSRAAEAYREAGDITNAARCFEEVYDWLNAIECYQDLGDTEKVLNLMERSGELYEAGMLAVEVQQFDRAINIFQQVDSRHPRYSECCRTLAEILIERGEYDLAVEKFDEGLKLSGTADAPLEVLNRYAGLLETAERPEDALRIYEGIRRRDVHFENVNAHIESLRKQLSQNSADVISEDAATVMTPRKSVPAESRYEIQGELGRGGMGVVYRALDKHLQRIVALKVLPEHLREHETALELFLREARSAAALNHRNIVTIYDAGQEGAMDFISMECLEGSGVDAILKQRGALNPRMVVTIALQVASGLDYAQKHKIIHRDIKPSNLFITTDRIVKIMDFGLAKMVEEVRRASTIIGGTPNYMAPEQAIGNPTDHRGDLYALGGTLFHLATGTVPYESGDVTYQHAHSPVPDPRERELSVPAALAELTMKLMAKAPEDRYQSAREVAMDLQAFLKSFS